LFLDGFLRSLKECLVTFSCTQTIGAALMRADLMGERPARFSAVPLYEQVKDTIAQQIADGQWKPNLAMPNENELARVLGVSPGTMRKALDLLESEGLVIRRQGRGTFVSDPTSPRVINRYTMYRTSHGDRIVGNMQLLDASVAAPTMAERLRLQLNGDDRIYRITRLRLNNGRPFVLENVAMPFALFPNLIERGLAGKNLTEVAPQYGMLLGKGEETLEAALVTPAAASALGIPSDSPVITLSRIIKTRDGVPAQYRFGEFHQLDDTTLRFELG
jgi:GntR family transcriptional regulator